jgi:ADP-ribosylglycohydrolase
VGRRLWLPRILDSNAKGAAMSERRILGMVEPAVERAEDAYYPRVAGGLIGAAAADALGWITEFVRGPAHLRKLYGTDRVVEYRSWEKTTGGRFNAYTDYISKGEYSDDTQLTLAVARSLLADGSVDIKHFANRELPLWLDYARGAGGTITRGARAMARKSAVWNKNFYSDGDTGGFRGYRSAGANGAAMRVGPLALANITRRERTGSDIWRTAIATHGHPRAILGALMFGEAVRVCAGWKSDAPVPDLVAEVASYVGSLGLPGDPDLTEWFGIWNNGSERRFDEVWEETRREVLVALDGVVRQAAARNALPHYFHELGCFDRATKGSGTGTVLAALTVFKIFHGDFEEAVVATINQLGSDTDTIGGFVGTLCGALRGYEAVPTRWASELQDYEYFMRVAEELARVSAGVGSGGSSLLPQRSGNMAELPDLLQLLRRKQISKGERVYHELFGPGWVESVDGQRLRRKDGARVVFAFVRFDIGQSCKFKYLEFPQRGPRVQTGPIRPTDPEQSHLELS